MIEAHLLKAFTQNPAEGNPAGVILDVDDLSATEMIKIAADLGFSESAFISKSDKADFRIRFFTPTEEVNLCAHATLAAVHALRETERIGKSGILTQETNAGILEVEWKEDGLITMTQADPIFSDYEVDKKRVAPLLGLTENDFTDWPLKIVSTGTPKLLIPIVSLEKVLAIQPDLEGIKTFCQDSGARGFYPFTTEPRQVSHGYHATETQSSDADFHARQFNPLAGINEDPITGIAAGALGAYLKHFGLSEKPQFIVEQGTSMGKPGRIFVDVRDKVKVGGYAVTFGETSVTINENSN